MLWHGYRDDRSLCKFCIKTTKSIWGDEITVSVLASDASAFANGIEWFAGSRHRHTWLSPMYIEWRADGGARQITQASLCLKQLDAAPETELIQIINYVPFKLIFKQDKWMTIMIFSLVHFDCILLCCHIDLYHNIYLLFSFGTIENAFHCKKCLYALCALVEPLLNVIFSVLVYFTNSKQCVLLNK